VTTVPDDHDDPGSGPAVETIGSDHPRASPADVARTLVGSGGQATLSTITDRPPGHPFGSLVTYAVDGDANPLLVVSEMAEHTRNATRDPRASILVVEAAPGGHDPLDAGRVTLLGELRRVEDAEQQAMTDAVVAAQPSVGRYAHFRDFSCWRLTVASIRWVGGFGAMTWLGPDDYRSGTIDPVLAARGPVLEHMNTDHGDACLTIASHAAGGRGLATSSMVDVDRFGTDFWATTPAGERLSIRVPFSTPARDTDEVRRLIIEQLQQARTAQ
jgi:putative heme iron utilization protein